MGLFEKIKKMIQDAIEYNNTGEIAKGNTKAVVGGAVYDAVKNKADKSWTLVDTITSATAVTIATPLTQFNEVCLALKQKSGNEYKISYTGVFPSDVFSLSSTRLSIGETVESTALYLYVTDGGTKARVSNATYCTGYIYGR